MLEGKRAGFGACKTLVVHWQLFNGASLEEVIFIFSQERSVGRHGKLLRASPWRRLFRCVVDRGSLIGGGLLSD